MANIEIVELKTLTPRRQQQLLELFTAADFTDSNDTADWLNAAISGSVLAVGALDENGDLVGFARALGDGVSDCYIQDVTVKSSCRKQGIGSMLVEYLLKELEKRHIDWIGLIATPGNGDFYRNMGFEVMDGHIPMVLKK